LRFGKSEWSSWERGIEREWLLTNGIGGFASSTIIGGNTRRYHGLLVAALNPPVERHLILSQLHEALVIDGREYPLHSFSTGGYVSKGFLYQQSFEQEPLPTFTYNIGDVTVEKTVSLVYGENTAVILYRLRTGTEAVMMKIAPLVNFRDYHGDSSRYGMDMRQKAGGDHTVINPYELGLDIFIGCPGSTYEAKYDCWFEGMYYDVEHERGLRAYEDHYIPGIFKTEAGPAADVSFFIVCTVLERKPGTAGNSYSELIAGYMDDSYGRTAVAAEKERLNRLTDGCSDEFSRMLTRSADHFIVYRRSTNSRTILAGYPWFTDWGRDAMISLSGLTLATGRYEDAADILSAFSRYIRYGLVPNMFPDVGEEPGYNTVDAALWYFEAVYRYVEATGDIDLVRTSLYDPMLQIYEAYRKGTLHDIHMDDDCLISAGNAGTQLTWMDARIDDTVFTPRYGKAVEINALWYNALRILELISSKLGCGTGEYGELADKVRDSFIKVFWNEDGKYLYDVVNEDMKDDSVRPNQIFAVGLPFPVIDGPMARCVVEKVWKELYTAYGLRSLSPRSQGYKGHCTGDRYERDSAYHQGTVWAWPIGYFITAFSRTMGKEPGYADMPRAFLKPFRDHLYHACLGSISEIFDGDEPLTPRGCCAQAWSVAEVLRSYVEVL
jgi:predicted glycogen debranching enzyme